MDNTIITDGPVSSVRFDLQPGSVALLARGAYVGGSPYLSMDTEFISPNETNGIYSFLSGESFSMVTVKNEGDTCEQIIASDNVQGRITHISPENIDKGVLSARGAFLASDRTVRVSLKKVRSFAQANLTGQSMWMQSFERIDEDSHPNVFLTCSGEPQEIKLGKDEPYLLDNDSLYAMTADVKLRLFDQSSLKKTLGGGEGRFMTIAQGEGTIWLAPKAQSEKSSLSRSLMKLIPGVKE